MRRGWVSEKSECFSIFQESAMIAIIDYGMGNLRSVSKAFEAVGHQVVVTRDSHVIGNASHVVLPGVEPLAIVWPTSSGMG